MLKNVHAIRPRVYPLAFSAYSQPSYLIYGDTIISSEEVTQQWDPEARPLFAETIQKLVNDMKSKINEWYLNDENLADDYKIVLKHLKRVMRSENDLGLSLNFANWELIFWKSYCYAA